MSLLPYIRKKIFWAIDFFRSESVRKHYQEIATVIEAPLSSESLKIKKTLLNDLLNHAIESTPFYASSSFKIIEDFPVVNKKIIQNNFEEFKSHKFLNSQLFKVSTSGSTGVPFFLFHNKRKRRRNIADVLYFSNSANFKFGEKLYYLEAWRHSNMSNPIKSWMKNLVYVDISHFDDKKIEAFLQELEKNSQSKHIIGLPSSFENICRYLDKSRPNTRLKINSIIAVSEYLDSYVENSMKKYFAAKVISRYSNEEMGIIAQQPILEKRDKFKINTASYFVEILKMDSNDQVEKNEMGRIVITDLFNYSMPLIRYDTGDISTFKEFSNGEQRLDTIEGRKMDFLYATNGELISPHLIHVILYDYFHLIKQYQFIQETENSYTIKLNVYDSFAFEEQLILDVKKEFGDDSVITIEYVDEIPPLSSGKRKKVINNYNRIK